jgi:DedD protein
VRIDNDPHDSDPQEREISLGTSTILGIFLALALVCAAFFGFGYSLGRHSSPSVAPINPEAKSDKADKADSPFSGFKSPSATPRSADDTSADSSQTDTISPTPSSDETPKRVAPQETTKTPSSARNVAFPVPPPPTAPAAVPSAAPTTGPHAIVQVSATSRQGDAESLIAALKQKGYVATIHHEPQDQLFHVQIGPFPSRQEAEATRKRLDTDGYKAIVK